MIDEKLKSLGIILPEPEKPAGRYIPVVVSDQTAYVSGQIPIEDGKVVYNGKVPTEQSLEQAQKAAKLCVINALAQLKADLKSLDRISKIIKVSGFVNSTQDFIDQSKVINAASDLLFEVFGKKGLHSRIAIGVASLPLGATVEIDMIVQIS